MKNLRTIRSILEEMKSIMEGMKWPSGQDASLGALLSAVSFHIIAVTKSASNEALVKEVFLRGDVANIMMMGRSVGKKKAADQEEEEGTGTLVRRLIGVLGFDSDVYEWHGSKAFAEYVGAEGFEPDQIAQDFQVFGHVPQEGQSLLERFRSYRTMDEGEFRTCVKELEGMVKAGAFENLQQMWEAHELLDHLSQQKLITTTEDVWRDTFVALANNFQATSDTPSSFMAWPENRDPNREAVLHALKSLEQRILAEKTRVNNESVRAELIEGKADTVSEGFNVAPFTDAKAPEIYTRLQAAGRNSVDRMAHFFRKRMGITNLQDFATSEVPFAKALKRLIDTHTRKIAPITLDDAAWLQLAAVLGSYITRLSPPPKPKNAGTQP